MRLTNRRGDLVAEGFDAALRVSVGRLSDSSLVARRLSVLEMQVFAAPTYLARAGLPRAPKDTADHAWVIMRGHKLPPSFPARTVKPRLVGDDVLFVCRACSAGAGLAVLPTFLARPARAGAAAVFTAIRRALPRASADAALRAEGHGAPRLPRGAFRVVFARRPRRLIRGQISRGTRRCPKRSLSLRRSPRPRG